MQLHSVVRLCQVTYSIEATCRIDSSSELSKRNPELRINYNGEMIKNATKISPPYRMDSINQGSGKLNIRVRNKHSDIQYCITSRNADNMTYLWLLAGWLLYFTIHSLMAHTPVKSYFAGKIGSRSYRFLYNMVALITLLPMVFYASAIDSPFVFQRHILWNFLGLVLATWGLFIAWEGFRQYNLKAFLGLGEMRHEDRFVATGILKVIRHPVYAGSILAICGYFLFNPRLSVLLSCTAVILYFIIGIYLEERKLSRLFGETYCRYKEQTPMLVPRIFTRKEKSLPE